MALPTMMSTSSVSCGEIIHVTLTNAVIYHNSSDLWTKIGFGKITAIEAKDTEGSTDDKQMQILQVQFTPTTLKTSEWKDFMFSQKYMEIRGNILNDFKFRSEKDYSERVSKQYPSIYKYIFLFFPI